MEALADLGTYPEWLSLVHAAEQEQAETWLVTLRARLGPLARSKRLRMVRTELTDNRVRFERQETDAREHAAWTLTATLTPSSEPSVCDVQVHLHYGGTLWSTPLEMALAPFESSAAQRLSSYLEAS